MQAPFLKTHECIMQAPFLKAHECIMQAPFLKTHECIMQAPFLKAHKRIMQEAFHMGTTFSGLKIMEFKFVNCPTYKIQKIKSQTEKSKRCFSIN